MDPPSGQSSTAGDASVNAPPAHGDAGTPGIVDPVMPPSSLMLAEEKDHGLPGCYRCQIAAADYDGDGKIDVVIGGAFDSALRPGTAVYAVNNVVRLYRNVTEKGGPIRFQLVEELPNLAGGGGAIVVTGDFNGDHLPDFAVEFRDGVTPSGDTSAFMNEGGWRFTRRVLQAGFYANSTSLGMAVGDIDHDGLDDLVFNSDGLGSGPGLWYKWDPKTTAWTPQQTSFGHQITYGGTIAAGDLDGDGFPEIIVGGNSTSPFGAYDCSSTKLYGEIHKNLGASSPGLDPNALSPLSRFALRFDRSNPPPCKGMDNASVMIADVDNDGHNDVLIAGSTDAFPGPPGFDSSQYSFVVLRNVDGTGDNFVTFESAGIQYPNGETNSGSGSVDFPNIAIGDLDGDGFPEVFIQGHHRDYAGDTGAYVFQSRLFESMRGTAWVEVDVGLPNVSEGGQAMADFDGDGKIDLMFTGASIPFHSNGDNPVDHNDASTLAMHVFRNAR
jgi:hypothetical protein